ncbi:uncharacterized protein SAPINGB_P001197 [Magnusiomyces paraingens]|uniref:Eukaryotic translation initiation factor 3 subunit J n=1 Tax=Magnusiomyces paraingens TaxID=2606893 RepID=A0A5E8B529_9ASCO|nr:uncharacterized protein SAPINGB_P001197 [Saprochaete ingens]VVT46405.1 unnamed protein product [Saprochaete ingens]
MSNWDDEDYDVDAASSALKASWDDEIEGDALDSWENALDEDDEDNKPKAPTHKRVPLKQKLKEKEEKERLELEAKALNLKEEDAQAKKERLKQVEQDNDMANLADLMGGADIHPRARANANKEAVAAAPLPSKLSDFQVFHPSTKPEFETLRKTLVPILSDLNKVSNVHYANLVTDITRDLSKTLSQDQIRKIISTLNAVASEKQRAERANRGKKPKAQLKSSSAKMEDKLDTTNYDDGLDDDDFM